MAVMQNYIFTRRVRTSQANSRRWIARSGHIPWNKIVRLQSGSPEGAYHVMTKYLRSLTINEKSIWETACSHNQKKLPLRGSFSIRLFYHLLICRFFSQTGYSLYPRFKTEAEQAHYRHYYKCQECGKAKPVYHGPCQRRPECGIVAAKV